MVGAVQPLIGQLKTASTERAWQHTPHRKGGLGEYSSGQAARDETGGTPDNHHWVLPSGESHATSRASSAIATIIVEPRSIGGGHDK